MKFRALLKDKKFGKIPSHRKQELAKIIKDYFKVDHLTDDLIKEASDSEFLYATIELQNAYRTCKYNLPYVSGVSTKIMFLMRKKLWTILLKIVESSNSKKPGESTF